MQWLRLLMKHNSKAFCQCWSHILYRCNGGSLEQEGGVSAAVLPNCAVLRE
jgi:hypothetical protein